MKYIRFCSRTIEHLINWVQCTFKRQRGDPRVKRRLMAWRSSLYEGCVTISTLRPCGLGCHMLGQRHTACLDTNLICNHMFRTRPHRSPAPRLRRTGVDDSPKPSCNKHSYVYSFHFAVFMQYTICIYHFRYIARCYPIFLTLGIWLAMC